MREIFADSFDTMANTIESDAYIDNYKKLAAAVIEQAVEDYRKALGRLYRHPNDYEAKVEKQRCERFFRQDMGIYSELDAEVIIRGIWERVNVEMGQ